jgi:hypothetical protein
MQTIVSRTDNDEYFTKNHDRPLNNNFEKYLEITHLYNKMEEEPLNKIMEDIEQETEKKTLKILPAFFSMFRKRMGDTLQVFKPVDVYKNNNNNNSEEETKEEPKPEQEVENKEASVGDMLIQVMKEGDEEFQKRTGRRMTYSEMRQMYG